MYFRDGQRNGYPVIALEAGREQKKGLLKLDGSDTLRYSFAGKLILGEGNK
jgi:hypothetical protein